MEKDIIQAFHCNTETGLCEMPGIAVGNKTPAQKKPVTLLYFTDPICSSCWGIEPQLRKLKQEYGAYIEVDYRMGGLLKSWDTYGGSDVNGPQSVTHHWEDASAYYQMPIDGDVWNEDPLDSSYPAAIAFKAAQLQGKRKSEIFLRRIKEMVFLEKKNITRPEHLRQAAADAGLDVDRFTTDVQEKATALFEADLSLAKAWGVRGFPTIYFIDEEDNRLKVYGSKPYEVYEQTLQKLLTGEVVKHSPASEEQIFDAYNTLTVKEYAVFYGITNAAAEAALRTLEQQGKVEELRYKPGSLWKLKKDYSL